MVLREGQIVARFRAVGVHAGEKDLSRTQLFCPDGPLHSVKARIDAAAVFVNIPAAVLSSSCVDGQNHALAAEFVRRPADELRLIDGRGIDRNFVRALLLEIALKSSTVRIPPPTVKGINTWSATRLTISATVARLSEEAVISRKTSSSAPASS